MVAATDVVAGTTAIATDRGGITMNHDLIAYQLGQALLHLYGAMTASEGDDDTSLEVWSQLDDIVITLNDLYKTLEEGT